MQRQPLKRLTRDAHVKRKKENLSIIVKILRWLKNSWIGKVLLWAVGVYLVYLGGKSIMKSIVGGSIDEIAEEGAKPRNTNALVDAIYDSLVGTNFLFVYPEIVNKVTFLTNEELLNAWRYWEQRYRGLTGKNIYDFIDAEFDGGEYEPALNFIAAKMSELKYQL